MKKPKFFFQSVVVLELQFLQGDFGFLFLSQRKYCEQPEKKYIFTIFSGIKCYKSGKRKINKLLEKPFRIKIRLVLVSAAEVDISGSVHGKYSL